MPQPNMPTYTVRAETAREGDFIPGLDNGYIVDVYAYTMETEVTFHDANGDEGHLKVPNKFPLTIQTDRAVSDEDQSFDEE